MLYMSTSQNTAAVAPRISGVEPVALHTFMHLLVSYRPLAVLQTLTQGYFCHKEDTSFSTQAIKQPASPPPKWACHEIPRRDKSAARVPPRSINGFDASTLPRI